MPAVMGVAQQALAQQDLCPCADLVPGILEPTREESHQRGDIVIRRVESVFISSADQPQQFFDFRACPDGPEAVRRV